MESREAPCPICRQRSVFAFEAGDYFYRVTDYRAFLFRCTDCRSLFQWPPPEPEAIPGFYPRGYWGETPAENTWSRLQETYIHWMLQADLMRWFAKLKLPPGSRFLDIGCGRGDWLALIAKLGYVVQGIESGGQAAAHARKRLGLRITEIDVESWQPDRNEFQGISAFHLLEHLRDPKRFLTQCRRALSPGGKLLLRVPNAASWQSTWFGKRWKGLEIPRHLVLFTPRALHHLLHEAGFRVVTSSTWSLRDGPPALASSLLPAGEPTRQQILNKSQPWLRLVYLGLTWVATPLEVLAALCRKGAMVTVIAHKQS